MLRALCLIAVLLPQFALAQRQTAFRAYTALPPEIAWKLVRIAACEGTPVPERWHFVVHDPQQPNGLRDYVVAAGRVVATNSVSQFASEARAKDILLPGAVRVDSDHVAALAEQYAAANGISFASLNYELRLDLLEPHPVWKVTCLDSQNRTLGWLVCDARTGEVVAHGNFLRVPPMRPEAVGEPRFDTSEIQGGFRRSSDANGSIRHHHVLQGKVEIRRAKPVERRERIEIAPLRLVHDLLRVER